MISACSPLPAHHSSTFQILKYTLTHIIHSLDLDAMRQRRALAAPSPARPRSSNRARDPSASLASLPPPDGCRDDDHLAARRVRASRRRRVHEAEGCAVRVVRLEAARAAAPVHPPDRTLGAGHQVWVTPAPASRRSCAASRSRRPARQEVRPVDRDEADRRDLGAGPGRLSVCSEFRPERGLKNGSQPWSWPPKTVLLLYILRAAHSTQPGAARNQKWAHTIG